MVVIRLVDPHINDASNIVDLERGTAAARPPARGVGKGGKMAAFWKELIEDERRYREKLIKVRAKKRRMPTPAECLDAMKKVLAEKREGDPAMKRYDDAWVKELADDARRRGGLVTSRFEDCKTVLDVLEALDEIMYVGILPPEERHNRRGLPLVIDNTKIEPRQA